MATMAGGSKPLRLKDLLELDCDSCSAAGFRCYPRRLCAVAGGAAAAAATTTATSSSQMRHPKLMSSLSKSLSRRLKGGFWRRHDDDEEAAAAPASSIAAATGSSSCCSSSDSETSSDSSNSTGRKSHSQSESEFSSASSDNLHAGDGEPSTTGAENEVMKMKSKEDEEEDEADDKEQFSPVGVMDFPFDEEDDDDAIVVEEEDMVAAGVCTPSFSDSLAQLQRRKMQMQPKIRQLGNTVELGGVDLEARFAASESDCLTDVVPTQLRCSTDAAAPPRHDDHRSDDDFKKDPNEYSLLDLLVDTVSVGVDDVTERLLLDFFVDAKCNSRGIELHAPTTSRKRRDDGETLRLAKAWLEGTGTRWNLNDVLYHGEAVVAEMERSRRWMHTGDEEREIGVVVAAMVVDDLMHELVSDLIA